MASGTVFVMVAVSMGFILNYTHTHTHIVLAFELRASRLLGWCSNTWAMHPALVCFIFWKGIVFFTQGWVWIMILLPIMVVYHHDWFVCWKEVSLSFFLGWPQTAILWISASQVAGITAICNHTLSLTRYIDDNHFSMLAIWIDKFLPNLQSEQTI
jgi:hypothetical protein